MASELFYRAVKLARSGRKDEARAVLKRVLSLDPRFEPAWLWYVDCQANDEDRIKTLEDCLKVIPESQAAMQGLSYLQARQGVNSDGLAVEALPGEPSPLFAFHYDDLKEPEAGENESSIAPFTVSPYEVTADEVYGAERSLQVGLPTNLPSDEKDLLDHIGSTQPVRVKPVALMPEEEELKRLFDAADAATAGNVKKWSPAFSDDGVGRPRASEPIKTRPRSASEAVPTRPRPTASELLSRPLIRQPQPANPDQAAPQPVIQPYDQEKGMLASLFEKLGINESRQWWFLSAGAVAFASMVVILFLILMLTLG